MLGVDDDDEEGDDEDEGDNGDDDEEDEDGDATHISLLSSSKLFVFVDIIHIA